MSQIPTPFQYVINCLRKQSKLVVFLLIVDPICLALMAVLPQYVLKNIIYSFSIASSYQELLSLITGNVTIYFIFFLISFFIWRLYDYYVDVKAIPKMKQDIILEVFAESICQTKSFFQRNYSGDIAEKIDDLQKNVSQLIRWVFSRMAFNIISISAIAACLLYFNFMCGVVTFSWIICIVVMSCIFARKIAYIGVDWINASSLLNGIFVDIFSNALIVKFFNNYKKELTVIEVQTEKIRQFESTIYWYFFIAWLIYSVTFLAVQIASFYVLIQQYKFNKLNAADFAFVWAMNSSLLNILWRILRDLTTLPEYYFSIQESLLVLKEEVEIVDNQNKICKIDSASVVFKDVSFKFEEGNEIFKKLSVTIKPQQKVALVGYSGSGKTTFLNLLLRLYDVQSGEILIDGQNIKDISLDSLYKNIAIIPQDAGLFHRSIIDNICYDLKDEANGQTVEEAIKFSLLSDLIESLPHGKDTLVGEKGSTVSGGQKQRIAIARAYLKNAPILILDEATSNLDSVTEIKIQENLESMMQGKTVFVVAHRLSTIRKMDRILVFDQGHIVQDGTHEELFSKEGLYRDLWKIQTNIMQDINEEL